MADIYVLPTEKNAPVTALVGTVAGGAMFGTLAFWSSDSGTWLWTTNGQPVERELAEAITAHAKSLGVEW